MTQQNHPGPSSTEAIATLVTQTLATILALSGFLMPAKISLIAALFVWLWALFWMQISELMKDLQNKFFIKKI